MRQVINQQPQYPSDTKIINNKYVLLLRKFLGSGAYGKVYLGHFIGNDKELVALKIMPKLKFADKTKKEHKILTREKEISESLKNKNVVELLDFVDDNKYYYFIQEYCDGGNLRSKLQSHPNKQLKEDEAYLIFCQILNGYHSLYQKKVIHRDLKPENILFKNDIAKIADFGFAKVVDDMEINQAHTLSETMSYCAPEILQKDEFCSKVDVWSLGCIFFEMLFGKRCFDQIQQSKLLEQMKKPLEFPQNIKVDPNIIKLIQQMLNPNPNARISQDQIFTNKLIKYNFQLTVEEESLYDDELINHEIRSKEQKQRAEQVHQKMFFLLEILDIINSTAREAYCLIKELNIPRKEPFMLLSVSNSKFVFLELSNIKKQIQDEAPNQQLQITNNDMQALKQNKLIYNEVMNKINNQQRPNSEFIEGLKTNKNIENKLTSENDKKSLRLFLNESGNKIFFEEYNKIIKSCIKEIYLTIKSHKVSSPLLIQSSKCIIFLFYCLYPQDFDAQKLKADINSKQQKDLDQEIQNLLLYHQIDVY